MIDANEYRRQGFLICRGFLPSERVTEFRAEVKEIFAAQMRRLGLIQAGEIGEAEFDAGMFRLFELDQETFKFCGKQAFHLFSLHRLAQDERIVAAVKQLGLTWPNIGMRPQLFFHHPRLARQNFFWRLPFHQDWRTTQGSLDSTVVWLPLVRATKDSGALEIVPGSHLLGLLPGGMVDSPDYVTPDVDPADVLSVEMEPGDALFFSTFMLHRSSTGESESIRWSCHFRYNNLLEETFIRRGYPHPFNYSPQQELITPDFPSLAEVRGVFDQE